MYFFKLSSFTRLKPFLILRHPVVIVMRKDVMLEIYIIADIVVSAKCTAVSVLYKLQIFDKDNLIKNKILK